MESEKTLLQFDNNNGNIHNGKLLPYFEVSSLIIKWQILKNMNCLHFFTRIPTISQQTKTRVRKKIGSNEIRDEPLTN